MGNVDFTHVKAFYAFLILDFCFFFESEPYWVALFPLNVEHSNDLTVLAGFILALVFQTLPNFVVEGWKETAPH